MARFPLRVAMIVAAASLALFVAVSLADLDVLTDPSTVMDDGSPMAAAAGVGLLVADVVLPVPSSLVMVAHGARFGVVAGAALSLVGRVGATASGAALGRGSRRWHRAGSADRYGTDLVQRWGAVAVVATRPVPVLAESVAVAAGAAGISWQRVVLAAALGSVPEVVVYASAGAFIVGFDRDRVAIVFLGLLAVTSIAVLGWRPARRDPMTPHPSAGPRRGTTSTITRRSHGRHQVQ